MIHSGFPTTVLRPLTSASFPRYAKIQSHRYFQATDSRRSTPVVATLLTWLSPDEPLSRRERHAPLKGAFRILDNKADRVGSDGLAKTVCYFSPLYF